MSVVIVVDGAGADRFAVTVSRPAELAASLHALAEHDHHPQHAAWATEVLEHAPAAFLAGLDRFAPLWTALRWRVFYPGAEGLTIGTFAELTAYCCVSGYHGFDFGQVLTDPKQAKALRHAAARLPGPHLRLAEDLLCDAERVRADIAAFAELCRAVYFDALWPDVEPALNRAARLVQRRLDLDGPAAALMSLSASSTRLVTSATGPERVVFDKVHHAVVSPARTKVVMVPTRFGAPHLLVKNEPGLPAVVHFPVDAPEVGVTLARSRLLALTDPHRVRLCRLIVRQAMTTADLADRLNMTLRRSPGT